MSDAESSRNDESRDRIVALFVLHALGDIIGHKNGDWDFTDRDVSLGIVNEMLYEFIALGGILGIDISEWRASSVTTFHHAVSDVMLKFSGYAFDERFLIEVKKQLRRALDEVNELIDEEELEHRHQGRRHDISIKYIRRFTDTNDARFMPYNSMAFDNDACVRCASVGIVFHREDQVDLLINAAVKIGMITHNSPLGYLNAFAYAYFVSLGIRRVPVHEWALMLLELLNSEHIKEHVDRTNNDVFSDYLSTVRFWEKYIEARYVAGVPSQEPVTRNLIHRLKFAYDKLSADSRMSALGASAHSALVMAYNALIDCCGRWEKLICYAMLQPGHGNVVGAMAGSMYGLVYGMGDVPRSMINSADALVMERSSALGSAFYSGFVAVRAGRARVMRGSRESRLK